MTKFRFLSVRFGSTWLFDLRFFTDTISDQTRFYLQQNKQVIQQFKQSVHLGIESLVHVSDVLGYLYILFVHVHIICTCTYLYRCRENELGSTSFTEVWLILVPEYRHLHWVHLKLCLTEPETAEMNKKNNAFTGNVHCFLLFDCILL